MNNPANDRIRHICNVLGITLKAFSEALGISEGTIKSMFNRGTNPSFEFLEKVADAYPDIDANWLITGKGSMLKENENTTPVFVEDNAKGAIPYYEDLPISAGEAGLSQVKHEEKPTGYLMIPNVSAEQLFPVIGCSMLPRIKPGDIVGVNKLNRWERVDPDKIYMIVTHDERMLKRLRRDNERDDILWCVSDNYQEFKIYKSEIVSIYHVVYHGELL